MPILVFRSVDPDAQVRFQTYRNYLVNLSNFVWARYGGGPGRYVNLADAQDHAAGTRRVTRRLLNPGQAQSVERSLRMAWAHETSLRLRGRQPQDVMHVLLHLALPEAYYAVYHAAQAYLTAAGRDVPATHRAPA